MNRVDEVVKDLERYSLKNGGALGSHSGIIDNAVTTIMQLQAENEQLEARLKNGGMATAYDKDYIPYHVQATGTQANHITDLLIKEEQGLLVKLPCKVGDTVYSTEDKYPLDISQIVIHDKWIEFVWCSFEKSYELEELYDTGSFEVVDIGKTVFLTRAEAEQALNERKENQA